MRNHPPPGTTLLELLLALLILAVLLAGGWMGLRRGQEILAVRAGRDALAGTVARARGLAQTTGRANLVVDPASAVLHVEAPPGTPVGGALSLGDLFGITLTADQHSGGVIVLEFDALGFGRVASRTFRIRRGASEARLTLSSYGRPRRW